MVKKLQKGRIAPKIASQQPKKEVQHQKDERIEYARSVFLNARRLHIQSGIGYKNGDKHNSRLNTRGQEFIRSPRQKSNKRRSQASRQITMLLIPIIMLLICHIIILMLLMYL
jgi:hypothetical protein